ncbi:MAG: hypothetical protein ACE5DU_08740, partial [Nitrosopumilus sp.]
RYGEHDITITVRYKDNVRDEIFLNHDATILVKEPSNDNEGELEPTMIVIPIILAIGAGIYIMRRRKKTPIEAS